MTTKKYNPLKRSIYAMYCICWLESPVLLMMKEQILFTESSVQDLSQRKVKPHTYTKKNLEKKFVEKPKDEIDVILRRPMIYKRGMIRTLKYYFVAAEMGNTKFLVELIHEDPDLIWMKNDDGQSIFHIADFHRHQSIFNLLYKTGSMKDRLHRSPTKRAIVC